MTFWIRAGGCLFIALLSAICIPGSTDNLQAVQDYNHAVELAYQGKYTEAPVYVDQALEENGNFTLAFVTRAGILNPLGRYPEAVEAADQAITPNPEQAEAWKNRASALDQMGQYEEGLAAADRGGNAGSKSGGSMGKPRNSPDRTQAV